MDTHTNILEISDLRNLDPNDTKSWIKKTDWLDVEKTPEYRLAIHIHQTIAQAYARVPAHYAAWYDQIFRSSLSVVNNFSEAIGKGKGWYSSALMIARGEAYETASSLAVSPQDLLPSDTKEKQILLMKLLSNRILAAPVKPDAKPFKKW